MMMTCPKCGFEQPKDQFCASCGVNVENYKPSVSLASGLTSLIKPILFVALLIGAFFFLFRSVENSIVEPEEVEIETTQIGSGASSLRVAGASKPPPAPAAVESEANITATRNDNVALLMPNAANVSEAQKFNQVQLTFAVGEESVVELAEEDKPNQNWHLVSQPSPVFTSTPEEVILRTGNNTFEYADELIVYDMNFFIEEITDKNVKVKLNIRRTLRALSQEGGNSNAYSIEQTIPLDQTLIIVDPLPRAAVIDRPNSILSTLYRSQAFLSRATEFVQIIKFGNPSNSPQE
jgi:hypothetical protein